MANLNLRDYESQSELVWLVNNIKLPKGMAWDFSDRPWQLDIIEDKSKRLCAIKPTQIGMSTVFLGKMLYFADMNQCRTMFTLPRQDDVTDMVSSRLHEIIQESNYIRNKMGDVDNVRMKRFGKSWIHFAEMSVPPRMMDVDWMLNDEVDMSNTEHLEQAAARMDASLFGYRHRISTPTIDDFGIDAIYKLSDQKKWVITCGYCSHDQVMSWHENVVYHNGECSYVCARCHNKIFPDDIREGRWVAFGNTKSEISGYHISHLMVPYISPNRMWEESKTMSTKNFYNFRLGLPFTPSSGSISRQAILDNCFSSQHDKENMAVSGNYIMGVDQGNTLTYVVGKVDEEGRVFVVDFGEIEFEDGFDDLMRIYKKYRPRKVVLDAMPNQHNSIRLAQETSGGIVAAHFTNINDLYRTTDDFRVNINKTDAYDNLLHYIVNGNLQLYGTPELRDFAMRRAVDHMCNMRRDISSSVDRFGVNRSLHIWKNVGPDHYADAVVYLLIAAQIVQGSRQELQVFNMADIDPEFYKDYDVLNDDLILDGFEDEVLSMRGFVVDETKESVARMKNPNLAPANPYKAARISMMGNYYKEEEES